MIQLFSNEIINEMNSDNPRLLHAVEILYPSAPVRAHTGFGEIVIDGQNYIGVGQLGSIEPIPQTSETAPSSASIGLSGLDPTLVAETLNERTQGSKVKIMVCSLDEDDQVTSASILFAGRVNNQKFKYGSEMIILLDVVDRLEDWQRKGGKRFDPESHEQDFPGDKCFKFMAQMSEAPLYWGSKKDAPGFRYD